MQKLYIPYSGSGPTQIEVNGHRVVLVSPDHEVLARGLEVLGGDALHEFDADQFETPEEVVAELSDVTGNAHIVLAPAQLEITDLLESLRLNLPWVH